MATQQRRIAELDRDVARYRRLVDNVPGMVYQFVLRPDGTMGFTFASEGSLEIYGHPPARRPARGDDRCPGRTAGPAVDAVDPDHR